MDRLERELRQGLRSVTAPPELWERVRAVQAPQPGGSNRGLVWALALAVFLAAVALSLVRSPDEAFAIRALADGSSGIAFRCQNPVQIRAWVRANTGLDLPLRDGPSPSIQLIGAQTIDGTRGVEVAYRAGNRDAVLVVSRAEAGPANVPHGRASGDVSGNVSAWVTDRQRFTLACNDPAGLQLACKLCHLD